MSTLTKEWLLTTIAELEEERDATPGAVNEGASMALAAMKLALASLEAEPVERRVAFRLYGQPDSDFEKAFENQAKMNEIISIHERAGFSATITPFYDAPLAPVSVPDALPENDDEEGNDIDYMEPSEIYALGRTAGWNAFRAAMLQGAEPVTTAYKLPEGWVAVPVEPTKEMIDAGWSYYMTTKSPSSLGVYGAMLAAAPQQEVKP
ncbi:hypothetical protein [Enterobacter hormaechei]